MKSFRFRLQRVLEYRQLQQSLEQTKLQKLTTQRSVLEQDLKMNQKNQNSSWISPEPGRALSASDLYFASDHRRMLKRQEAQLLHKFQVIEKDIQIQQQRVLEAKRRQELLEKLKLRRRMEWQTELDRELEELASDAYRSRLSAGRSRSQALIETLVEKG